MNKLKKYIAITLLLMSAILPSSTISHAGNLPDDIYNALFFEETIPADATGSTPYSGNTYTIIPRVDSWDDHYYNETGVRFDKIDDPNDETKSINESITYQVLSKGPYGRNYRTWRTDKILVNLSVFNERSGKMIPVTFFIRPLPLQNITDATTQITFSEEQVLAGMRESWREMHGEIGEGIVNDLEDNIRKSFQYGCGLSVGAEIASIWIPKVLEPQRISDLVSEANLLTLMPFTPDPNEKGGIKPVDRSILESEARAWANSKRFKY